MVTWWRLAAAEPADADGFAGSFGVDMARNLLLGRVVGSLCAIRES
ncbi:hypothetical protein [Amycolatopsis alba]|nr:hypothetical protein [Amycolatopsis alba]